MLCHKLFFEKSAQIENFSFHNRPNIFKMVEYTKKVTESNHKTSLVILFPKSPQSPNFTIKKGTEKLRFPKARDGDRTRDPLLGKEMLHR